MHNSYYFIKHLSKSLADELVGLGIAACFSQNRDELVLGFCNPNKEFWMKASLQPDLCMLVFPKEFHRAKKNSVDLFPAILDQKVLAIRQFLNERAFALELSNDWKLCFKMYGNRANVVLYQGDEAVDLFRKKFEKDASDGYGELDKEIDQRFEAFQANGLKKCFPTFGKTVTKRLYAQGFEELEEDGQWKQIQEMMDYLSSPTYYVVEEKNRPALSVFPENGEVVYETKEPLEAANEFFYRFSKVYFTEKAKERLRRMLQSRIKKSENYITKNEKRLHELEHSSRYEETANIIMANLHNIDANTTELIAEDFYRGGEVTIKINPRFTPQKNAERLYRKAKNQKVEMAQLKENIEAKETLIFVLDEHLEAIEQLNTFRDLAKYQKQHGLQSDEESQEASLPFKRFLFKDFVILVGKHSKGNDVLTQQYSYKEDLWLHARDVTGSHVVIKHQANRPFPKLVIEKAASLAAYYSQAKHNSLHPVIYTPKKYVRKVKNAAPGQVVIDKEEVVMVAPKSFEEEDF